MIKNTNHIGFADLAAGSRKIKDTFFKQIDTILDWKKIERVINKHYTPGQDAVGNPSWSGLMLFKINLLGKWYNLSDPELENSVNDRISFSRFVGLSMDDCCPDHSTIWRFRERMKNAGAFHKLLDEINRQLGQKQILVVTGALCDASITQSELSPKGPITIEISEDRQETEAATEQEEKEKQHLNTITLKQQGVDKQARWLKKGNKTFFGYKKHTLTNQDGLVLHLNTTPANRNDGAQLEELLKDNYLPRGTRLYADKGYHRTTSEEFLTKHEMKNGIQFRATRNHPLNERQKQFNKLVSKTRYAVERTFGGMVRWFGAGITRYRGRERVHTQHLLEAMAYNLKLSPALVIKYEV